MFTPRDVKWLVVGGVFVLGASAAAQPGAVKAPFTIGPDTTRLTGPVLPDGSIDYDAALNVQLGKGVTPENNAAPLFIRAFGPGFLNEATRSRVLAGLKLGDSAQKGPYFPDPAKYWADPMNQYQPAGKGRFDPWRQEDDPVMAGWLNACEPAFQQLEQASRRPRYWFPAYADPEDPGRVSIHAPNLGMLRRAANALIPRATLRLGNGDLAGARNDFLLLHRLARLTVQGGSAIEALVGIAMDALASYGDVAWACDSRVTAAMARDYLAELQALPPMVSFRSVIGTAERYGMLEVIMEMQRKMRLETVRKMTQIGSPGLALPADAELGDVDWDRLLRTTNQWYDRMADIAGKPFMEQQALWKKVDDEVVGLKAGAGHRDATGRLEMAFPTISAHLLETSCVAREKDLVRFELAEVALGARAYYADKGKWPGALSELVPAYLQAIPADRFADKQPVQMTLEDDTLVIWSVGPEGKRYTDDAGKDVAIRLQIK